MEVLAGLGRLWSEARPLGCVAVSVPDLPCPVLREPLAVIAPHTNFLQKN